MSSSIKLKNANGKTVSVTNSNANQTDKEVIYLNTVDELANASGSINAVAIVSDLSRGGTFEWSATGTANGGTVFAGATGYWNRQYSGAVSVKWFGAKGDGITDDTSYIQNAVNSNKDIIDNSNSVYIVNSGINLTCANKTYSFNNATFKLANNATIKRLFYITADNVTINGGKYDGNKASGNTPVDTYSSYAIGVYSNNCTIKVCNIFNIYGIGIKGKGNHNTFEHNTISGTTHYGIFMDADVGVDYYGNKALYNNINMSDGGIIGQGILFTSYAPANNQIEWEFTGNTIYGSKDTLQSDKGINLACRGIKGIVSNNYTKYGSMGFSEGGDNTIISNNIFADLVGSTKIGIESSGKQVITGNTIYGTMYGISLSVSSKNFSNSVISNNTVDNSTYGIRVQPSTGYNANNITICGNNIKAPNGVLLTRETSGSLVNGNTFIGTSNTSDRAIYIDTPTSLSANISITGNVFNTFLKPWMVYSATANTFSNLYASGNTTLNCNSSYSRTWTAEGSAIIGSNCKVLGISSEIRDTLDSALNIFTLRSTAYNNPEGVLTAGIGSTYQSLNTSGGAYFKASGTGNTGWVAM